MPSRECANGGSAPEASDVRACEIAEVARPAPRKSVISAVVKLRREQIRMARLCSRDREQRQLPTMEINRRRQRSKELRARSKFAWRVYVAVIVSKGSCQQWKSIAGA